MANQEGQVIDQLGPKFLMSTGDYSQGVGGRESAAIKMTNDSGERCTFKHLESGLTRLESEGNLEVIAGEKSSEGPTIKVITPHGDIDFKVEEGFFKVKATNICFDADDSIVFKASKIQMGDEKQTKDIVISGQRVEYNTKKGNLAAVLKTDSLFTSFLDSFVTDKINAKLLGTS